MNLNLWIIPILPLAGAAINGLAGKRFSKALVNTISLGSTALAFAYALWVATRFFGMAPNAYSSVSHMGFVTLGLCGFMLWLGVHANFFLRRYEASCQAILQLASPNPKMEAIGIKQLQPLNQPTVGQ